MKRSKPSNKPRTHWRAAAFALTVTAIALAAAGCGDNSSPTNVNAKEYSEVVEKTFSVDNAPHLDLTNFIGNVTVSPSGTGLVHITATKYAAAEADLDRISLAINGVPGGVDIISANPNNAANVSVEMVIESPEIANWELTLGVGKIVYDGRPSGNCSFSTSVGDVDVTLPQNMNAEVNFSAGVGTVSCAFQVDGQVTGNSVFGKIGNGSEARISASTGVGRVTVRY